MTNLAVLLNFSQANNPYGTYRTLEFLVVQQQFHVVYDKGFTSLTYLPSSEHTALMDQLFRKATWMHSDKPEH